MTNQSKIEALRKEQSSLQAKLRAAENRQKYLESRGWRIHRVWTPGMWKNPDREISRIIEAIERSNDAA